MQGKPKRKLGGGGVRERDQGNQQPDVGQWAELGGRAVVLRNRTDRKTDSWLAQSSEDFKELGLQQAPRTTGSLKTGNLAPSPAERD